MKLRIRGSSLRLRVTKGEVDRLLAGETVSELVPFGPSSLAYALCLGDALAISARFASDRIEVQVPVAVGKAWLASDQVGIAADQAVGERGPLQILIEKDFACLKPRQGEDDSDAFPHPTATRG